MGDVPRERSGPELLGLGWVGSCVVAFAAVGTGLGAVGGALLSRLSDRSPDEVGPEIGPVLGTFLGAGALLPLGVLLGFAVGLSLRSMARTGRVPAGRAALAGLVLGALTVTLGAVCLAIVANPADSPGLPPVVVAAPAAFAGVVAAGLSSLMARSAARLSAWPS